MVEVEGGGEGLYELDGLLVEEGKGEGGKGGWIYFEFDFEAGEAAVFGFGG